MPPKLLNDELIRQIKELFDNQLEYPLELLYFSNKDHCDTCDDAEQLLEEISSINDKVHLTVYDVNQHPGAADKYNMPRSPGLVITGREQSRLLDYGIRFSGIPAGYEFGSLIQAIVRVSKRNSGLKPTIREELKGLAKPIQLHVFVTPT